jgi:sulfotransferase
MLFFNSSMPRSGSTLFQNVLGQNPDIHVTPTDGSLELLFGAKANYTSQVEFKAQDPEVMRKAWLAFCKAGLEAYAGALSDKPHTCIKSRGIGISFNWYSAFLGEDPKVICTVRDVKAILASMEKIHRRQHAEGKSGMENHAEMRATTTAKRVQDWLRGPPVGLALERFGQMDLEGIKDKCLIVRYEDLCQQPDREMARVYRYLGLPAFAHNFDNVEQITVEDDVVYGLVPDLHVVRKEIRYLRPDYESILGADVCNWVDETCAGYQLAFGYAPQAGKDRRPAVNH